MGILLPGGKRGPRGTQGINLSKPVSLSALQKLYNGWSEEPQKCEACGGTGDCSTCHGDGKNRVSLIITEIVIGSCKACNGTGVCPVCNGRGLL